MGLIWAQTGGCRSIVEVEIGSEGGEGLRLVVVVVEVEISGWGLIWAQISVVWPWVFSHGTVGKMGFQPWVLRKKSKKAMEIRPWVLGKNNKKNHEILGCGIV